MGVAKQYIKASRFSRAEAVYLRILDINPDAYGAWLGLAEIQHKKGNLTDALNHVSTAIGLEPYNSEGAVELGLLHLEQQDNYNAGIAFEKALKLNPLCPKSNCYYGVVCHRQGRIRDAEAYLRKALILENNNEWFHYEIGLFYIFCQKYDQAIDEFLTVLHLNRTNEQARLQLAVSYRLSGQFDFAQREIDKCCRMNPAKEDALLEKGMLEIAKGEIGSALSCFQHMVSENPLNVSARYHLGLACRISGLWEDAKKHFDTCIEMDTENRSANFECGKICLHRGQFENAVSFFEKVVLLDQTNVSGWWHLAHANRCLGKFDKAKTALDAALSLNEKNHWAYFETAMLAFSKGNLQSGRDALLKMAHDMPIEFEDDRDYFDLLRQAYPLAALKKFINGNTHFFFLGKLHWIIGNYPIAHKYLSRCLAANPNHLKAGALMDCMPALREK